VTRRTPPARHFRHWLLAAPFLLTVGLATPQRVEANWLVKLARMGEHVAQDGAGTAARTGARGLMRAEAIALTGTLSGDAVYADMMGGRLILHAVKDGVEATIDLSGDFVSDLHTALRRVVGVGAQKFVALSDDTARALGHRLDEVTTQIEVRILRQGLPPMPLLRLAQPGLGLRFFVQVSPGLVFPLETRLTDAMVAVLAAKVRRDAIVVAPLFSRTDVGPFTVLAEATGDRIMDITNLLDDPARWAGSLRDRLVVVVGHVEGDAFVIRSVGGTIERRVPIAGIDRLAQAGEANLVLTVGCNSFGAGGSSGFLQPVTDLEVARSLRAALEARTNAEFLSRLGTPDNPLVVTEQTLGQLAGDEALRLERLLRHESKAQGAVVSVRLVGRLAATGRVATALEAMLGFIGVGAASLALMFRRNRAAFLEHFPTLPNRMLHSGRYWRLLALREAVFWSLGCIVAVTVVGVILLGRWRLREAAFRDIWGAVLAPLRTLVNLGLTVISLAASYLPSFLIVELTLILFGAVQMLPASGMVAARLIILLAGGYGTLWTWRRMPALIKAQMINLAERYPRIVQACGTTMSVVVIASILVIMTNW